MLHSLQVAGRVGTFVLTRDITRYRFVRIAYQPTGNRARPLRLSKPLETLGYEVLPVGADPDFTFAGLRLYIRRVLYRYPDDDRFYPGHEPVDSVPVAQLMPV